MRKATAALIGIVTFAAMGACGGGESSSPATPPPVASPPPPAPPPPPAIPANLRFVSSDENSITWAWDSAERADGYDVELLGSDLELLDTSSLEETAATATGVPPGATRFLRVRSFAGEGTSRMESDWTLPVSGRTSISRDTNPSVMKRIGSTSPCGLTCPPIGLMCESGCIRAIFSLFAMKHSSTC